MKCPKCTGVELQRGRPKGSQVELDQCPSCGGLWFDQGELGAVLGPVAQRRAEIPERAHANARQHCPRCGGALVWFCFPGTTTVIDACRGCHGVWLDAGEVKSLRASLDTEVEQMTCPKCQAVQPKAESCARCGVVVARLHGELPAPAAPAPSPPPDPAPSGSVKEKLLSFIDESIARLTH